MAGEEAAPAACLFPGACEKIELFLIISAGRILPHVLAALFDAQGRSSAARREYAAGRNGRKQPIFEVAPGKRHAAGRSLLSCHPPCTSCQKIPKAGRNLAREAVKFP